MRTMVAVLTWNRVDRLRKTLDSFHKHNGTDIPIFVFNNNSTDGTRKFLDSRDYISHHNSANLGPYVGTVTLWQHAAKQGYDYLLNLEDDFPCKGKVPFGLIEKYLDKFQDVGFVRLNEKRKYKKRNISTHKRIVYDKWRTFGDPGWLFRTSNHHFTCNPIVFRSSMAPDMKDATSEYNMMDVYTKCYPQASELKPFLFKTLYNKRQWGRRW